MTPIKEMCCKDSFAMNKGSTTPAAILPGKMEWCGIWNLNALERGDPIEPSSFHGTTVRHSLRSPLPFRRRYFCFVIFRPFSRDEHSNSKCDFESEFEYEQTKCIGNFLFEYEFEYELGRVCYFVCA